jgi:hypothetical protein
VTCYPHRPTRADAAGRAYLDLRRQANQQARPTQELLTLYVLERFMARLAASDHAGDFILKGGMLMAALHARRPTVDIDLLAERLANDEQSVLDRLAQIATLAVDPDDGVTTCPRPPGPAPSAPATSTPASESPCRRRSPPRRSGWPWISTSAIP